VNVKGYMDILCLFFKMQKRYCTEEERYFMLTIFFYDARFARNEAAYWTSLCLIF
jgi:hypothetical protein